MYPNYNHSEWLILERPSKNWRPDRLDVVVFQNGWEKLTKRVIALEGEAVKVEHGKISINGKFLQEPYGDGDMIFYMEEEQERMKKPKHEWLFLNMNLAEIIVPKGYVWVVGDNRSISWYGLCEVDDIVGVSLF
jgi:signal peptidase I